jgi:hypothetical protein
LLPESVSLPVPTLVNATVLMLLPSWILPEKAPPLLPLPTVSVDALPLLVMAPVPAPLNALIVGLLPFRSSVPPTVTSPMGSAPAEPSFKVPAVMLVKPV